MIAGKQQAPFPGIELPSTSVNLIYISGCEMIYSSSDGSSVRACVDKGFALHLVKMQSGLGSL